MLPPSLEGELLVWSMRARAKRVLRALIEAWNDVGSTFPDDPVEPRPGLSLTALPTRRGRYDTNRRTVNV